MGVVLSKGDKFNCPVCDEWIATAKTEIVGDETVIDDDVFEFVDDLWGGENADTGMKCPGCGMQLDGLFVDTEYWTRESDE